MTERLSDLDAWFDEQEGQSQDTLPTVDPLADLREPDEIAQERRIAEEVGEPSAAIRAYPELFSQRAEVNQRQRATEGTPRLRAWLDDPQNAAVARDDIEALSTFESADTPAADTLSLGMLVTNPVEALSYIQRRLIHDWTTGDPAGNEQARQGELDVEHGRLAYRSQQEARGWDRLSDEDRARLDELATREGQHDWGPFILGPTRRLLPQMIGSLERGAEQAGQRADEAWDNPMPWTVGFDMGPTGLTAEVTPTERITARRVLEGGVAATAQAPGALLGAIGGAGGGYLSFGYEMETGIAYDQMVRSGIDPEIAAERAEQYGGWATAIEFVGEVLGLRLSGATRLATRTLLAERVLPSTTGAVAGRTATALIGTAADQGVEEAAQEYAQIIHQDLARQDQEGGDARVRWAEVLTPEAIQQILMAGYIGAQGGAGMAAIPAGANFALDTAAAQRAEQNALRFEVMTRAAQESLLGQRLPSSFESAVNAATDNSSVFIDADRFVEHFQSAGISPYAVAEELGVGQERLSQALASHGQVEIPTGVFAARVLRIPAHAVLANHTRVSPTDATPAEIENANETFKAQVERIAQESEAVANDNELGVFVEGKLRELFQAAEQEGGYRPEVSRRYAQMAAALPRAMVARARAVDPAYADKLEQQFRTLFGERFDIAGPGRDGGFEGAAELDQRGVGPDAGPVRSDRFDVPEGVRMSERMRKIVEMAVNGASNDWIAEEMDVEANNVRVTLSQARARLGLKRGQAAPWEAGATGLPAGTNPRTGRGTPTSAQLAAMARTLAAAGYTNRAGPGGDNINTMIARRTGMNVKTVASRLSKWRAASRRTDGEVNEDGTVRRDGTSGELKQFAGERSLGYDEERLLRAEEMEEIGHKPNEIWRETGWWRDPNDKKWRYEINDEKAEFINRVALETRGTEEGSLIDVLRFPELFAAYPQLANLGVMIVIDPSEQSPSGAYDEAGNVVVVDAPDLPSAMSALLHEVQHAIQAIEGFANGGSVSMAQDYVFEYLDEVEAFTGELVDKFFDGDRARFEATEQTQPDNFFKVEQGIREEAALRVYMRFAGEIEARNVQRRRGDSLTGTDIAGELRVEPAQRLSAEERKTTDPSQTVDRPLDSAIVPFESGGRLVAIRSIAREPGSSVGETLGSPPSAARGKGRAGKKAGAGEPAAARGESAPGPGRTVEELAAELADLSQGEKGATRAHFEGEFPEGARPRNRGIVMRAFKPGEFGDILVRMTKAHDLSTFLHEYGHVAHYVLEAIAREPNAPAEFQQMWQSTLDWWGVTAEQWESFGRPERSPYLERWARTFEAYLMEGKAPSLSLREAFAAFKAWLTDIYKKLFRLDHNLNPQIRDVFDRLLATDQEMAEARAAMGSDFSLPLDMFSEAERALIIEARDAQEAELRARVFDSRMRRDKRWWRSERERVRTTAEIEVDSDPARRAMEWIAFNEWRALPVEQNEDGVELPANAELAMPEGLPEMRLDMSTLDEADRAGLPAELRPLANEADADAALDNAMALKRQGRARQPQRLWSFIKAQGGIKDEGGEITQALGSARGRPGLINNTSGLSADELALRAYEAGYFGTPPTRFAPVASSSVPVMPTAPQPPVRVQPAAPVETEETRALQERINRLVEKQLAAEEKGQRADAATLLDRINELKDQLNAVLDAGNTGELNQDELPDAGQSGAGNSRALPDPKTRALDDIAARRIIDDLEKQRGAFSQADAHDAADALIAAERAEDRTWSRVREEYFKHKIDVEYTRMVLDDAEADAYHAEWMAEPTPSWQAQLRVAQDEAGNWAVVDQTGTRQSERVFANREGALMALQNIEDGWPETRSGTLRNAPDGGAAGGGNSVPAGFGETPFYRRSRREIDPAASDRGMVFFTPDRAYAEEFPRLNRHLPASEFEARLRESNVADLRNPEHRARLAAEMRETGYDAAYLERQLNTATGYPHWRISDMAEIRDAAKRAGFSGFWLDDWGRPSVAMFDSSDIHVVSRRNIGAPDAPNAGPAEGSFELFQSEVRERFEYKGADELQRRKYELAMPSGYRADLTVSRDGVVSWRVNSPSVGWNLDGLPDQERAIVALSAIRSVLEALRYDAQNFSREVYRFSGAGKSRQDLYRQLGAMAPRYGYEMAEVEQGSFELRRTGEHSGFELFQDPPDNSRRPTPRELLDALIDDIKNVRQVYSSRDEAAAAAYQNRTDAIRWFEARGIDLSGTKEEIRAQIMDALQREQEEAGGGWSLDDAAPWFGFSSGSHLLHAMKALKPRAVAIEENIEARLEAQYGDPLKDGTVQEAATLAAHIEAQSRRIEIELDAIQRATGGRRTPVARAARAYAERQIQHMTIKQLRNHDTFLAGERRAARAAMEATEKKDFQTAALMKQRQLINFHLYRLARDAAEEMEVAQRYFAKFDREGVRKKFLPGGAEHLDQIDQVLETIDLRRNPYPGNRARASFQAYIQNLQDQGIDTDDIVEMDPDFLKAIQRRPFTSLTLEEARGVRDVIQNLENLGSRWNQVLTDQRNRRLGEVIETMVDHAAEQYPKRARLVPSLSSRSRVEQAVDLVMDLHGSQTKFEQLARVMDGLVANGPWFSTFIPAARRAQGDKNARHVAAAQRMNEMLSVYTRQELGRMLMKKEWIPEIGDNLTRMQQIGVLLYSGTEYRRANLMKGFKWSEQQLQTVIFRLDERDVRFAQAIWAFLDSFKAESFDLDYRVRGVRPQADPGIPVITRAGVIQGSYFPIKFDPDRSKRAAKRAAQDAVEQLSGGSYRQTGTKRGRLKQLVGSAEQPFRLDVVSIVAEHIEETVHDLSHREFVIDARRLLASDRVRTAISQVMGPWGVKVADAWVAKVEQPKAVLNSNGMMARWERIAGKIKNNATVVNMGLKVTTALIQELGSLNAIPRTGIIPMLKQKGITIARDYPMFLARQTARLFGAPETLPARIQFIFDRSPFMRDRMSNRDRDVRDAMASRLGERPGILPQVPKDAQDSMLILSGLMDMAVAAPAWLAGYESALAGKVKGITEGDEQAAIDHADSIVATTQSGGAPMDLAAILANDNQFWRLATMFMSWANTFYNQMFVEQIPGVLAGKIPPARFAANMLFIWFVPSLVTMWFYGRSEPQEGEDDEEFARRSALEVLIYPLQTIPIVRDAINAYITHYDYQFTPAQAAFEAPIKLAYAAERGDSEEVIKQGLLSAGYMFGLPSRQMWITGEGATDLATGEEDFSEDPVDSMRELFVRDTR